MRGGQATHAPRRSKQSAVLVHLPGSPAHRSSGAGTRGSIPVETPLVVRAICLLLRHIRISRMERQFKQDSDTESPEGLIGPLWRKVDAATCAANH